MKSIPSVYLIWLLPRRQLGQLRLIVLCGPRCAGTQISCGDAGLTRAMGHPSKHGANMVPADSGTGAPRQVLKSLPARRAGGESEYGVCFLLVGGHLARVARLHGPV